MAINGGVHRKCVIGEEGSLCWYCKTTSCEWRNGFRPVPGWTAMDAELKLQPYHDPDRSYSVFACPKFERGTRGIGTELEHSTLDGFMKGLGASCVRELVAALRYLRRFDGIAYEDLSENQRHRYNEMQRVIEHEETFIRAADTFFGMRSEDVIKMIRRRVADE